MLILIDILDREYVTMLNFIYKIFNNNIDIIKLEIL